MAKDDAYPFGCRDLKVFKITSLSVPTYATGVDVRAIQEFSIDPIVTEAILRGDDVIKSSIVNLDSADFTFKHGGVSLGVWEAILGATASDSATTPNEVTYLDLKTSLEVPYFGAIVQIHEAETAGDTHFQLFKCRLNALGPGSFADQSYNTPEFGGRALPGPYDSDTFLRVLNHETAVAPSTTWPGSAPYTSS